MTTRDHLAADIRRMRAWHAERPHQLYVAAVGYLRAVARTLPPTNRADRIALARAVREAAMVDPQHYAEAHRLAQTVRPT